jgi:hypothetical protein
MEAEQFLRRLTGLILQVLEKGVASSEVYVFSLLSADLSNNIRDFFHGAQPTLLLPWKGSNFLDDRNDIIV